MIKTYKGYSIPDCVDNPLYRDTLLYKAASTDSCVACRAGIPAGCDGAHCSDCILQMRATDKVDRLKCLREYVKANPVTSPCEPMPELRPGMLLRNDKGDFLLYVTPSISLTALSCESGVTTFTWGVRTPDAERIREVWWAAGSDAAVPPGNTYCIITKGIHDPRVVKHWKRPNPVREMTVDEISRALGYEVKVVGSNEKVDD